MRDFTPLILSVFRNSSRASSLGFPKCEPGMLLNGIIFIMILAPCTSFIICNTKSARCSASSGESLIPPIKATSIILVRSLVGLCDSASRYPFRSSVIENFVVGTSFFRSSSLEACTLHANAAGAFPNILKASGVGPTVDIVIFVWRRPNPVSPLLRTSATFTTDSALSAGSPIPINTTPSTGTISITRHTFWARNTCTKISSTVSDRSRPIRPVAQNVQPCRQPTWEDMHTVLRSFHGIITVSTSSPSAASFIKSLVVPSLALVKWLIVPIDSSIPPGVSRARFLTAGTPSP
mmetsp:Transcript_13862/g.21420  ORF Transcript_13862/g.21420 Transcript_13862/m.21420 type:complete len:293 (-) Transcript_13862:541-1419(-)